MVFYPTQLLSTVSLLHGPHPRVIQNEQAPYLAHRLSLHWPLLSRLGACLAPNLIQQICNPINRISLYLEPHHPHGQGRMVHLNAQSEMEMMISEEHYPQSLMDPVVLLNHSINELFPQPMVLPPHPKSLGMALTLLCLVPDPLHPAFDNKTVSKEIVQPLLLMPFTMADHLPPTISILR